MIKIPPDNEIKSNSLSIIFIFHADTNICQKQTIKSNWPKYRDNESETERRVSVRIPKTFYNAPIW